MLGCMIRLNIVESMTYHLMHTIKNCVEWWDEKIIKESEWRHNENYNKTSEKDIC